jgi:hypothetical protein
MQPENTPEPQLDQASDPAALDLPVGSKWVGRLFILMVLVLAVVMGGFAVWVKYSQGRRTLQLWGTRSTWLIRHASQVRHIQLGSAQADGQPGLTISPGSPPLAIKSSVDVSLRKGVTNARYMLIVDMSYRWDLAPALDPDWTFALEFREGEEVIVMLFDTESGTVQLAGTDKQVVIGEKLEILQGYLKALPSGAAAQRPEGQ